MFRNESGYRTYNITTRRITSGDEWKYLNGLAGFRGLGMISHLTRTGSFANQYVSLDYTLLRSSRSPCKNAEAGDHCIA